MEGVANAAVTSAMDSIAADIMATLGAVAPYGIGIFGIFLAWKYGKKIFNTVSR